MPGTTIQLEFIRLQLNMLFLANSPLLIAQVNFCIRFLRNG